MGYHGIYFVLDFYRLEFSVLALFLYGDISNKVSFSAGIPLAFACSVFLRIEKATVQHKENINTTSRLYQLNINIAY